jgi:hypothetical protein
MFSTVPEFPFFGFAVRPAFPCGAAPHGPPASRVSPGAAATPVGLRSGAARALRSRSRVRGARHGARGRRGGRRGCAGSPGPQSSRDRNRQQVPYTVWWRYRLPRTPDRNDIFLNNCAARRRSVRNRQHANAASGRSPARAVRPRARDHAVASSLRRLSDTTIRDRVRTVYMT